MLMMIRGTHGSGKSTLVKRVMALYQTVEPVMIEGRKRPFGYRCSAEGLRSLFVLGSYATATGGCDTISEVDVVYEFIHNYPGDLLFEGILAQHSTTKLLELNKIKPVHAIVLTTTLEKAIESVAQRRAERGDDRPMSTRAIQKEYKSVLSSGKRMQGEGVRMIWADREVGFQIVASLMALDAAVRDLDAWKSVTEALPIKHQFVTEQTDGHVSVETIHDQSGNVVGGGVKVRRPKNVLPEAPKERFDSPGWANGFMRKKSAEQTEICSLWDEDTGLWYESDEALKKRMETACVE